MRKRQGAAAALGALGGLFAPSALAQAAAEPVPAPAAQAASAPATPVSGGETSSTGDATTEPSTTQP